MSSSGISEVYFYNSRDGDRKYNADSMTEWLRPFFTTGVFNAGLQVVANSNMTVTIQPGHVNIGGKVRDFKAPTILDLETASGTLNRIDNIIVRRDDVNRDIYLMVQTGGLSANPTAPSIIRSNGIHDLKLAEVYISAGNISITQANITDTRMIKEVCGWVTATVTEMDFTQIYVQFEDFFNRYKPQIKEEFESYIKNIILYQRNFEQNTAVKYKEFEEFVKSYKQYSIAEYNDLLDWFSKFKEESESDFGGWFAGLQDTLDSNQATNLYKKIEDHEQSSILESEVHGLRLKDNRLQVYIGYGWANIAAIKTGLTAGYFDNLSLTAGKFDSYKYTSNQFDELIEVED